MQFNKKTGTLLLFTPLLIGLLFTALLQTHFYVYLVYSLLGIVYYLLEEVWKRSLILVFDTYCNNRLSACWSTIFT